MLSEEARRTVMNETLDTNQRFKVLIEELHWREDISVNKLSKHFNVPSTTLPRWMKYKMNIKVCNKITVSQLANTKYAKCDFNGNDAEKLKA